MLSRRRARRGDCLPARACGCGYFIRARRNYGMYASRYPLLPPAVPSAPDNRPCPPPILFVPVGPAGHPGTVAGSGAENRIGWSSP
ncbi:hypothetical protein ACIXLV_22065 [Bacteroides fragilis]